MNRPGSKASFAAQVRRLREALDALSNRRVILFGGKGGVGKTTLAALAALHFTETRDVTLFTADPASKIGELLAGGETPSALRVEPLDASALFRDFLGTNLDQIVELGDRGTYLDRDEIRTFLELSLPGIDELMAWRRIGALATARERLLVVDTAPTGHALRMLASGAHFEGLAAALEAMQDKHRAVVEQLTHRSLHDAIDDYLERFGRETAGTLALLRDGASTAFVPLFLPEPWVIEQTVRLVEEVGRIGISIPYTILNRAPHACECARCRARMETATTAVHALGRDVVRAPDACSTLDSPADLYSYLAGKPRHTRSAHVAPRNGASVLRIPSAQSGPGPRILFFAGKGGVGKTTCASSVALQIAAADPSRRVVLLSVDPAHSVRDVFARVTAPPNLTVETIDTRARWNRLREKIGDEVARAVSSLTPGAFKLEHDAAVMDRLLAMAPPGADEIFATGRIADLARDPEVVTLIVDTAPTGHFLRLLDLPATAGAWVREFMRVLLRYREVIPAGSLGQQLLDASRDLREFEASTKRATIVVVTRPERLVLAETARLLESLASRGLAAPVIVVNHLTPSTDCLCDATRRDEELSQVATFAGTAATPPLLIGRRPEPPVEAADLRNLVPLEETDPS
ncbi:MAG: TRC40/GET3/ArsA family transport-energizing ATPase [Thermoanaerobaculia bacterium]